MTLNLRPFKHIILFLFLLLMILWMAGCCPKISQTDSKADIGDFVVKIELDTNYTQNLRPRVLKQLETDSVLKANPLDEDQKQAVAEIIYKEVTEETIKHVKIDTTFHVKNEEGDQGSFSLKTDSSGTLHLTGFTINHTKTVELRFMDYIYKSVGAKSFFGKVLFWVALVVGLLVLVLVSRVFK